jgi:uncharacterized protein YndB with AHSA1/START domain
MTELTITRYIAAPPAAVWNVLANRKAEWWCPLPWRAEFDVDEKRAGGQSVVTMYGPDGEVHPHKGTYLAFDEGRRFASTDAITGDLEPATPFMIGIWEIAAEGDGTRYTARARHWSAEDAKRHQDMGFEQGWGACADQLVALCEGRSFS